MCVCACTACMHTCVGGGAGREGLKDGRVIERKKHPTASIYTCTHKNAHIHIRVEEHKHIKIYTHKLTMREHTHMHLPCTRILTNTNAFTDAHMHAYTHHVHAHTHTLTTHTHIHIHSTRTHTHIHLPRTHTHTYTHHANTHTYTHHAHTHTHTLTTHTHTYTHHAHTHTPKIHVLMHTCKHTRIRTHTNTFFIQTYIHIWLGMVKFVCIYEDTDRYECIYPGLGEVTYKRDRYVNKFIRDLRKRPAANKETFTKFSLRLFARECGHLRGSVDSECRSLL